MGKTTHNDVFDAMLAKIATATVMTICSQEPANRTEAVTTYALADVAPSFTGPADGDASGRKIASDQKTGVTVDASGTGTHIALCDGTILLYVTTCTSQALTSGNTMTFNAWDIEVADPT